MKLVVLLVAMLGLAGCPQRTKPVPLDSKIVAPECVGPITCDGDWHREADGRLVCGGKPGKLRAVLACVPAK